MSYARSPRGVSSTMYGIRVIAALLPLSSGILSPVVQLLGCTVAGRHATVQLRIREAERPRRTGAAPRSRAEEEAMDAVEREVTVPAPPEVVWKAVSRDEELSAWFGADVGLEVEPGGRGLFRWPDGTERGVVVEEVEPERKLSFRWLPFQRTAEGD